MKLNLLLTALIMIVLTGCSLRDHGFIEPKFPVIEPIKTDPDINRPVLSEGSLYSDQGYFPGFISDTKAYRLNDVLIVNISESTNATSSATTGTERTNEMDMGISNFMGWEADGALDINPNIKPSAMIGTKSESKHDGTGTTKRSGIFTGTLASRVVQVLPNGYLMIQGYKTVQVNGELGKLYLSGLVNPLMIDKAGSISSNQIADLNLVYGGQGTVAAQQKPGWLSRVLTAVWPF